MSRIPQCMTQHVFVRHFYLILSLCQTLNPNQKNLLPPPQNLKEVSFQLILYLVISCLALNPLCLHPTNGICGWLFTGDFDLALSDALGPGEPISPLSFQKQCFFLTQVNQVIIVD